MTDWWQETFPQGRQTVVIEDANQARVAIAYGEKGSGQPLFCLHGIGSWSYSWRKSVDAFSQQFRTICVDAKGYGFSQRSPLPEKPGHQVGELVRIMESLTDQPAVLVAESMGALTALAVAQTYPHLIDRLVLVNVPIFPQQLPSLGMRWLADLPMEVVHWADQLRLVRPTAPLVRWFTHQMRQEVVADPACITEEEIYWLTYPYIEFPGTVTQFATDLRQAAREIRAMQKGESNLIHPIQQNLHNVTCPTLILWADQDRWFPAKDGEALRDRLPNARLQMISNCGHNASGNSSEAVNAAVLSFLNEAVTA